MILLGAGSLRHCPKNYASHCHAERNHQGKGNVILFLAATARIGEASGEIRTRERSGRAAEVLSPESRMSFLTIRGASPRPDSPAVVSTVRIQSTASANFPWRTPRPDTVEGRPQR